MAEQIKFDDRLFLRGEKVLFDNGTEDAIIESRNGTLVIKGNLVVDGTTTSVNTINTEISDPFMLLNSEHTGSASDDVGIEIQRDVDGNVKFGWDETNDRWTTFGETFYSGNIEAGTILANTSITGPLISSNVNITGGNINNTVIGDTDPVQAYFTDIYGDGTNITNVLTNYTTTDLAEGTNLYYTDERVDDRISNLFDASYGISATYTDPANTFEISFDATNIGTGEQILDTTNTTQAAFRTLSSGPNLDLTVSTDGDNIVVDTAVKINNLEFNTFTGTGSVSQFVLPYTVSQDWQVLVYIDGVVQEPSTAYTIVGGNTLTLSAPLGLSSVMNVIKMASNTVTSNVTDANTLNAQPGSYYLDYNNFFNVPLISQTTIGDVPPTSPLNGHLWWDSSTGRLKIYYEDIDSSQWVDTNPATGTATITGVDGGSSYTDADVASYLGGNLNTHILPASNNAYDIGSESFKIRDLYLSDNSLHIGDNIIRTSGDSLLLNNQDIMDYSNIKNKPDHLEHAFTAGTNISIIPTTTGSTTTVTQTVYEEGQLTGPVINITPPPGAVSATLSNENTYGGTFTLDFENKTITMDPGNTSGTGISQSSEYPNFDIENTLGMQFLIRIDGSAEYTITVANDGSNPPSMDSLFNQITSTVSEFHEPSNNSSTRGMNTYWIHWYDPNDPNFTNVHYSVEFEDITPGALEKLGFKSTGDYAKASLLYHRTPTHPDHLKLAINYVVEVTVETTTNVISLEEPTITLSTLKSVVAASSDFADFQSRIAAL